MEKTIVKFSLDGKIIFSKPLLLAQTLATVRETIKTRIAIPFNFLDRNDKPLKLEKENDITLENIIAHNSINLKSIKENDFSIKIFLNGDNIISLNYSKKDNLNEIRNLINNKIQINFIFLDKDGNIINIKDEDYIIVEDILNNEIIKIVKNDEKQKIDKIINKPKIENKKEIDFSKYDIIENEDGLTIYKYSNIQSIEHSDKKVYQHFYDGIEEDYFHAYVVLFCGLIGDGKTTAINALFNIIKGVKYEDNYRFILVSEKREKYDYSLTETKGVHLYYIKDYNDKPIILIDSEGFGDFDRKYEEKQIESFNYTFTNLIDHINAFCLCKKSITNRLTLFDMLICIKISQLFSEDISENFVFLSTFAHTIKKGPAFIDSIKYETYFLEIQDKINGKLWYAFDGKCILEKDIDFDIMNKYSFSQLNEFYEEKVKKLKPKSIKYCSSLLNQKYELKVKVNKFKEIFKNLLIEYQNLKEKQKNINNIYKIINKFEEKIMDFEKDSKSLTENEKEIKIISLNNVLDKILNDLNNEYEKK